jgi:KDO2-lipid IV(A) lauroyltransferase
LDLGRLTTSSFGITLGAVLSRLLPLRTTIAVAYWLADRLARRPDAPDVHAVRFNHQILEAGQLSPQELDERVRAVFRNSARGVAEVLYFQTRPHLMPRYVEVNDRIKEYILGSQMQKQPFVLACPHVGNFDLAGRVLGLMGLRALILAEPTPRVDYNYQNRLRRQTGLNIQPISLETLRTAAETLEAGGSVLTGVDWPVGEARYRPRFFGIPSRLTTSHTRLAVKAGAPVTVVACHRKPDGKYTIVASEPVQMQKGKSITDTILGNTETILAIVEQYVRQNPEQWLLYYPVWEKEAALKSMG